MLEQMPFKVGIGPRPQLRALSAEILLRRRQEGMRRFGPRLGLVARRVFAVPHARMEFLGSLTRGTDCVRRRPAECHAAMFGALLVLVDERARATVAQPKSEAGKIIVKKN